MSHAAIMEKISQVPWYHAFELIPGVITPGHHRFNAKPFLDSLGVPDDLRGERLLDIGTWDGPTAFELESRGATVVAADIQDPDKTGFNTAKRILGAKVQYVRTSVYDLGRLLEGKFDRVFYFGVFYHLKHPLLGFEEIHKVMADDGLMYFEGACLRNYAETLDGRLVTDSLGGVSVRALADSELPLTLCYPGNYISASNWFVPNYACFRSWMKGTGFETVSHYFTDDPDHKPYPIQRIGGIARKVSDAVEEHPLV